MNAEILLERRRGIGANQFNALPMPERFWTYTERAANGCLIWIGAKNKNGYGSFAINGKTETASRVAYLLSKGEIPKNLFVLHRCDNPLCVEPCHLFLGTHQDNMKDRDNDKGNAP